MSKSVKVDFHGALNIFDEACQMSGYSIKLLVNPLAGFQFGFLSRDNWLNKITRKAGILFRHFKLAINILLKSKCYDFLVVREFSTIPLLLVTPFFFPLLPKLRFIINHNLQWAIRSKNEKWAFDSLCRLGVGFVFFEINKIDVLDQFHLRKTRHWVLPHPVGMLKNKTTRRENEYVVGVIGQYRAEKGMDEMISAMLELQENTTDDIKLIMGFSNVDDFLSTSAHAGKKLKILDTRKDEDYYNAICSCDILLLNYQKDSYEYRASGLIADAASCRTAIIIPAALPVLYNQLTEPCPVGEIFINFDELPNVISKTIKKLKLNEYNFSVYHNGRNSQALAEKMDDYCQRLVS